MKPQEIDFSSVLAASAHDMKNGLCLVLQLIEQLSEQLSEQDTEQASQIAQIHYETSRLNSNLLQLLTLYREQNQLLPLNIDQVFIDELIDEMMAKNQLYVANRNLSVSIYVEQELSWYLDKDLIGNLLNDIFVNAMRYCKSSIEIHAFCADDMLNIQILDDGEGYPASMLQQQHTQAAPTNLAANRTGLGLYFAQLIASSHQQQNKRGQIHLANDGNLGGSVFTLALP